MKTTVLSLIISLISLASFCQNYVSFSYDDTGNRLSRATISLKSGYIGDVETLAVEETLDELSFKMYPNPTKELLTVEIENYKTGTKASISIYDLQGRQIYENKNVSLSNSIDLSTHSPGTYILILKAGDKKSEWKIVKE